MFKHSDSLQASGHQIASILSHNHRGAKGFKIAQQPIQDGMDGVLVACKNRDFHIFLRNRNIPQKWNVSMYIYI